MLHPPLPLLLSTMSTAALWRSLPAVAMALGLAGATYWYWSTGREQAQKQGEPGG